MAKRSDIPAETRKWQAIASDPSISAWVSANAGSGKTFVLARRVIRLLLDGNDPGRILCLTFTKAAAAEMANRVFGELGAWVGKSDAELAETLQDITGKRPDDKSLRRARTLFALALDTPGGLKIQTIHAFCEALLHQFPLEANVPGHFEVLEDTGQAALLTLARDQTIARLESGASAEAAAAREWFATLLDLASDARIDEALDLLTRRREAFRRWSDGNVDVAMAPVWAEHGMAPDSIEADIAEAELAKSALDRSVLEPLIERAREEGKPTNLAFAERAEAFLAADDPLGRWAARRRLLLTRNNTPLKTIVTKAVAADLPDAMAVLETEQARTEESLARLETWRLLKRSHALFRLADAVLERYDRLKRRRGLADFDDLITATANLLLRKDVRQWVQYKLDRGIDHVLIDEAQDTSPEQWRIINAIIAEFHAGEGASPRNRTVFAVGDEKQSIYSFQGADPKEFSRQRRALETRAAAAGKAFEPVPLNLSFRAVPDLLDAVDTVFADPANHAGLAHDGGATVHEAIRRNDPGEVRIWPLYGKEDGGETESWLDPPDALAGSDPQVRLAERIADTIKDWLDKGEKLPGAERKLSSGDILILVRKRDRFSAAMVRALKARNLAIAGADRFALTGHIAVEDLMALGRVMLMPEDDLALAGALKSPLFGLDDDALIELCANRAGRPLFDHLRALAEGTGDLASRAGHLAGRLTRWRAMAARDPAHAFYYRILGEEGGRKAVIARLGTEAEEAIDAFLRAALEHDLQHASGLEGFLSALSASSPEIKREVDVERDEIRVITVHAAKGLEAPVVFLVDPCSKPFDTRHRPSLVEVGNDATARWYWQMSGDSPIADIRARHGEIEAAAEAEYRRLLYVGMTRAADRLIVAGYHGKRAPAHPHWHAMISDALLPAATEQTAPNGEAEFVWRSPRADIRGAARERDIELEGGDTPTGEDAIPGWLFTRAPFEAPAERPLSPSRAAALLDAAGALPGELRHLPVDPVGDPAMERSDYALERGRAMHALLQFLPDIDPDRRADTARNWLDNQVPQWPQPDRDEAFGQVMALLSDARLAPLFGPGSRAEANIAGHVEIGGSDVLVAGQIDRIAVGETEVTIADYKTNRIVPQNAEAVPRAYLVQMALYRALIGQIHPDRDIRCLLVWTASGEIMEIAPSLLEQCLADVTPA